MRYLFISLCSLVLLSCREEQTLFRQLPAARTGIHFNNKITESDSINPIDMEFLYNGGGVAVGDFNNDGLQDLYFTASQVSNQLYLNKGKLSFANITTAAGVAGKGRWSNAASVVDINNDGWQDLYVCATINKDPAQRANLLYVNQGVNANGIPVFKEMAAAYNLADTSMSVHAAFFDYDRDGDLDLYLVATKLAQRNSTRFDGGSAEDKTALRDKLYRNDFNAGTGHAWFTDVSDAAGIADEGYGLGVAIADINRDGWKDIYVTNDFFGSDLLYINNRDGTFSDKAATVFKHTSQNAMGNDIADINNDGLADIVAVDMNPEDNFRKKKNMGGGNYFVYQTMLHTGTVLQYVRNTLQLNNGLVPTDTGNQQLPVFSDIAFYAGVAETDWSWSPLLADFDNDGYRDLVITNGYPRDVTDHDFAAYRSRAFQTSSKKELLDQIPQIKIANYAFRNKGNLQFENATTAWGFDLPTFSAGAVYADLDNDGDLDYVINNINDKALVYENRSAQLQQNHYLQVGFDGPGGNKKGLGAEVTLYYGQRMQRMENAPNRGYLSTVAPQLHFGLGQQTLVDSLRVLWPDGRQQVLRGIPANRLVTVRYDDAAPGSGNGEPLPLPLFTHTTTRNGIRFRHEEMDHIDFNYQKLLPHKLSQFGPALAAGDLNGDGRDDLVAGAAAGNQGVVLQQQADGTFIQKTLPAARGAGARRPEMMGLLLFDADGDGDNDVYAASGSNEFAPGTRNYQDQLFVNDGKGGLHIDTSALPHNLTSKSCVKAADFDRDGDLDLFVGGRVQPHRYPEAVSSSLYRNDSKGGRIRFTDVTPLLAPALLKAGLVCDALWTDWNNDNWPDLVLAGEWMPITVLHNRGGSFSGATTQVPHSNGWWNSLAGGDFDNDGDIDFVGGNLGLNAFFKASIQEPAAVYAADFDGDQAYDAVPALYLHSGSGERRLFPAHVRDEMAKQMIGTRRRFPDHKSYARADINTVLTAAERQKAVTRKAYHFASSLIRNDGGGRFTLLPLPAAAQLAPLNGMVADDVDGDGNLDLCIVGNDYGNEVANGRHDALNGLLLLGDGRCGFRQASLQQSGMVVKGDGKALVRVATANGYLLAASQNRDRLLTFTPTRQPQAIRLQPSDSYALLRLANGRTRRQECYWGTSFLSQSSRQLLVAPAVVSATIYGTHTRTLTFNHKQ